MTALEGVLGALDRAGCPHRSQAGGYQARCPAHEDRVPSLAITNGDGKVLLCCHAGCSTDQVLAALSLDWSALFDAPERDRRVRPEVVATHDYRDADGVVLYQKLRYFPKDFRVRRPDGRGGWTWKIGDVERVLYRLPEVAAAACDGRPIFVAEGERDCDRLAALGHVGTTNYDGASKNGQRPKWRDEYSTVLRGADVTVIADNDEPGRAHARAVAASLKGKAASVRLVRGAVDRPGADLSDHLDAGFGLDALVPLEPPDAETQPPEPGNDGEPSSWSRVDLTPFLDGTVARPTPGLLVRDDGVGLFYPGKVHWAHGESESGKSWVAQIAAVEVITDGGRVLYIDHESDPQEVTARLIELGAHPTDIADQLTYVRPDDSSLVARNAAALEQLLGETYDLAVLDGVTDGLGLDKASTKDTDDVAAWMRRMPRRIARCTGAAVLAVDHVTKDSESRGRFAIGSQAKMAGIDGAAFVVEPAEPLGEGLVGEIVLRIAKDRPGSLRRHGGMYRKSDRTQEIARIRFDATDPKRIAITVGCPKTGAADGEPGTDCFRPTTLMEKVSRVLEAHPDWLSSTAVQQAVQGKKAYVRDALDVLVQERWVERTTRSRGSADTHLHRSVRPFRAPSDSASKRGPGDQDLSAPDDRVPGPGSKNPGTRGPGQPSAGSGTRRGPGRDPVDQRKRRDPVGTWRPGPKIKDPVDFEDHQSGSCAG